MAERQDAAVLMNGDAPDVELVYLTKAEICSQYGLAAHRVEHAVLRGRFDPVAKRLCTGAIVPLTNVSRGQRLWTTRQVRQIVERLGVGQELVRVAVG